MKIASPERMMDQLLASLGSSPLFRGLNGDQLAQVIKFAELLQFDAGEVVVEQGQASDTFFLIVSGEAGVTVQHDLGTGDDETEDVMQLGALDSFGEMGLLLGTPRTATVRATARLVALRWKGAMFQQMFQKIPPFGWAMSSVLAERLTQSNRKMPLASWEPGPGGIAPDVLRLLPLSFVQRHRVLPLETEETKLLLGCVEDPTPQLIAAVRKQLPAMQVRPVHLDADVFQLTLSRYSGLPDWPGAPEAADEGGYKPALDQILRRMVAEGASDLHLSAGQRPRWRVDGEMRELSDTGVLESELVRELFEPIMTTRNREEFDRDNDTDFAYALADVARFRVNLFRDLNGVGAVLRQIPTKILSFEQLGLPSTLKDFCKHSKGLVLVTGPTGSGKSTTLAAMVDYINRSRADHILTLEDPVEFVHESKVAMVNQREVGSHTNSFSRALRAALREDPDIVLVGEMRDLETISLALETANTGHLVFGTLHTATAISTVDRIINLFPADEQAQVRTTLAEVLKGVVAQTLCARQRGGRVAAVEVMVCGHAAANLIREGKTHQLATTMVTGKKYGNLVLNDQLAELVRAGTIEAEEAMAKTQDRADLAQRLGAAAPV